MSEHVDVERIEVALFLLECDKRKDPWGKAKSDLGERFLGTLPHGSGGREDVGEVENTSEPWGLQLRLPCVGMGILGDMDGSTVGDELEEIPLGTSTQLEISSFEQNASEGREESVKNISVNTCRLCNWWKKNQFKGLLVFIL